MTEPFVILHLSDTHIGNPKYNWDSISVFDSLIEDLSNVAEENKIEPNLIIFSGDLAFGEIKEIGLEKQYELVDAFLNKILKLFGNRPHLFIVPGNHDLNRNVIDKSQELYRNHLTPESVEAMMIN